MAHRQSFYGRLTHPRHYAKMVGVYGRHHGSPFKQRTSSYRACSSFSHSMNYNHVAVFDIGKTNVKVVLVDTDTMNEIKVVTRPNTVFPGPPWSHFDTQGIWDFLLKAFTDFHAKYRIDAISVTTHGACVVLLDHAGNLGEPVLDYEHTGPDLVKAEYEKIRPSFAETGSPRLGMGLNVGAQLFWQIKSDPSLRDRVKTIVSYPQY